MTTVTDASRRPAAPGVRAALVVAVSASAMAGLVHVAAARGHDGEPVLFWMFVLCAAAQVLWAGAVALRPTRPVLVAGLVVNGGAVLVWALTRTVGIPFIDALAEVESAGTQDLVAALFAGASAAAATRMLAQPVARVTIAPMWAGALAVVALLGTMPALRAEHTHGGDDHTHLEAAGHAHGEEDGDHAHDSAAGHATSDGTASHAHDESAAGDGGDHAHNEDRTDDPLSHAHTATDAAEPHGHAPAADGVSHPHPPSTDAPHDHPTDPSGPTHPHPPADPTDPAPSGPIISLDDPRVTSLQRAIATGLIDGVRTELAKYPNVAAVTAAGYISIGDGGTDGYEHFVNWSYLSDARELDPARIESIVVKKGPGGTKTIVSGMYILSLGETMADAPILAGELTTWHDHQNLCFQGTTLVGLAVGGVCSRGVLTPTPPMLHVWIVDHPCGPFAGIESHGGACVTHDH